MEEKILLGRDQDILGVPQDIWKQHLPQIPQQGQSRLRFMTAIHHQIRYFVVKELAHRQEPLEPGLISTELKLPLELVNSTLEELESKLFFLVRNERGAVAWAYPVTVEITPHRMNFSGGERLYAA